MDLATTYLGLDLRNPLIASASPLTGTLDGLRRLEDAGAAAVVLPSLFEEQIEAEAFARDRLDDLAAGFAEANGFFPAGSLPDGGPQHQLDLIARARAALAIPVIASLNGTTDTGWTNYARLAEQAGAQAIELNVYLPAMDPTLDAAAVEQRHVDVLAAVKRAVRVPVAMKLGAGFSAPGAMIRRLDAAGADGLVLFNRFYQPDIDLVTLRLWRHPALSTKVEIRPGLLWIAALAGTLRAAIAAGSGVEGAEEVVKYLLVGADVVMTTSALLRHGPGHLRSLLEGLARWGEARDFASLADLRGRMSRGRGGWPSDDGRGDYIGVLLGYMGDR
ncbi:MAG: dihydroorotate dehydrogenase-like protein [Proteobacteria bacterium]|nr:dihydroorotate dehydrogenase-like protein [Pseudomonadota bacterium]